jgi:hypothetical protein
MGLSLGDMKYGGASCIGRNTAKSSSFRIKTAQNYLVRFLPTLSNLLRSKSGSANLLFRKSGSPIHFSERFLNSYVHA